MITMQIDDDKALDMLMDRVRYWRSDATTLELFEKMYQDYIDSGCFEGCEFDVMQIVDNDIINWCSVIELDDTNKRDFRKLLKMYNDGERDFSCEHLKTISGSYIEAVSDDETSILVRD